MKSKVTLWAVCTAVAIVLTGCNCCQASDTATSQAAAPTVQKPMKAVTPDGEAVLVIAEWDAEAVPCNADGSACKTAKCWQTKDGKTFCVKPVRECPKNGKDCPAAEHFKCKKNGKMMCTQDTAAAAKGCCTFAGKEVKPCPKNGSPNCGAAEHVKLPQDKKGCAKADVKNKAKLQAGTPVDLMTDGVEEDTVFLITSAE